MAYRRGHLDQHPVSLIDLVGPVAFDDGSSADVLGHYFSKIDNRDYIEASTGRPTVF